ncbi:MAG: helix-turn-helix transcriptional regulator [Clostridia bacterium]|nr:helix-turn-helix transcriptional regulator [Clostridia bacterium]
MELGLKIKNLRQIKNLTQEELADRCELTKGYISQLENDLTTPSIETLKDLLNALGTTFGEFFDESDGTQIVFKKDEYIEKITDTTTIKWLVPSAQKNSMEPIIIDINENCQTEKDMPHEGEEFGFVLNGKIELVVGKKSFIVKTNETFYFTADKPHYIKNIGASRAKIIWVSNPPNF